MQVAQSRAASLALSKAQCKVLQPPLYALAAQQWATSSAATGAGSRRRRLFRTCAVAEPEDATSNSSSRSSSSRSSSLGTHHARQQALLEPQGVQGRSRRNSSSSNSERGGRAPLENQQHQDELGLPEGRYSYKMVKAQPVEIILNELRRRRMGTWGRKDQLASRLYGALGAEGRALSKEESVLADAKLGLDDIGTVGLGSSGDSDSDSGSDGDAAAVAAGELASSAALAENPLLALQSSLAGRFLTELNQERMISNFSSLQLHFLWGVTSPNGVKLTTSCLARTAKSVWLFECGEDAQRHLSQTQSISWSKLERIFVSSLAADNIAGLPGMLCTISAAREKGHEAADTPLHVYGPAGLAEYINAMLSVSRTYLEMPVIIHEFSTGPVPEDQLDQLVQVNPRARLYVTRLPPDQLNPEGYYDGEMRPLLSRHTRKRSNSGIDERAGMLPLVLPSPGDPSRTGLSVAELTWTLKMDHAWLVRVFPLRNKQPTFGYLMQEAHRAGKLYAQRAKQLGLELNEECFRLKMGQPVQTPDGRWVQPSQCVGPARRGRRIAFVGSCLDASGFAQAVAAAGSSSSDISSSTTTIGSDSTQSTPPVIDILVHCMSPPLDAPLGTLGTAAATAAGTAAAAMNAKELVLWQRQAAFAETPQGRDEAFPAQAIEAARRAMGSEHVSLGGCYWCYNPERDPEPAEWPEEWGDHAPTGAAC